MNVTVEIGDSSGSGWIPEQADCELWIRQALESAGEDDDVLVSLQCVAAEESMRLNNDYRDKARATNVLAFPAHLPDSGLSDLPGKLLGDIVICPEVLVGEAESQGKSLQAHWAHLLVHGTLHLLGYVHDDQDQTERMESLEIQALKRLGFPNPYLIG